MTCLAWRRWLLSVVLGGALVTACAPGVVAVWSASGEYGEANFFKFRLDLNGESPVALYDSGNGEVSLAVCDLTVKDRHVEFKMDPAVSAQTCDKMEKPYLFIGDFGLDVLTGQTIDSSGRLVGVFRAFRVAE